MNLLSFYLAKFANIRPPQSAFKQALLTALGKLHLPVEGFSVKVRNGIAFVEANPLLKSELMLKKTELLALANEELGAFNKKLIDIR